MKILYLFVFCPQVDSGGIKNIAKGKAGAVEASFIKIWCQYKYQWSLENRTVTNVTEVGGVNVTFNYTQEVNVTHKVGTEKCKLITLCVAANLSDLVVNLS
jgi:hypothetical protein